MKAPPELGYTETHEWVRLEPDGKASIGITDHAQEALGDIVFIELPEIGRRVAAGEACAVVESVKAAADVFAPIAGVVVAVHDTLAKAPEMLNMDAYASWLFRLEPDDPRVIDSLLSAQAYAASAAAER